MDAFALRTPFDVAGVLMLAAAGIFAGGRRLLVPLRRPSD